MGLEWKENMKVLLTATLFFASTWAHADWQYQSDIDKMTSKKTTQAVLESNNSLSLPFPYAGKNKARLQVRQHPKYGLDVFLDIDKGQIMCSSYRGCPITIRFDSTPAIKFSGNEPADSSSDTIFIQGPQKFIAAAKKAKVILVEITMYQAGNQILEFQTTKPLEWSGK
jgi:hypothetical protein